MIAETKLDFPNYSTMANIGLPHLASDGQAECGKHVGTSLKFACCQLKTQNINNVEIRDIRSKNILRQSQSQRVACVVKNCKTGYRNTCLPMPSIKELESISLLA